MLDQETFARAVAERPTFALLPFFEDGTFDFMPDAAYLPFEYKALTGNALDLENPRTFNEKINWLKLHDHNPLYKQMVDKLAARAIVEQQLGKEWLVPLLGVWDDPASVDFDALPGSFVLKATNGYGGVVVCPSADAKASLDRGAAIQKIARTMKTDFFSRSREWAYKDPTPRVIAEAYVDDQSGTRPADYKFMCFNGTAKVACVSRQVSADHKLQGSVSFYDRDGQRLPFKRADYPDYEGDAPLSQHFERMRAAAELLAQYSGATFVRVDFFCPGGRPLFSEFTFYPCGGSMFLDPPEYDLVLGGMLELPTLPALGEEACHA